MSVIPFPPREHRSKRQQQLAELYACSERILKLGEEGDWKQALETQRQRRVEMESFFAQPATREESGLIREVIEAILALDKQVSTMLYQQRSVMMDDVGQLRQNSRKLGEYVNHS